MKLSHTGVSSSMEEIRVGSFPEFTLLLRGLGRILFSALILSDGLGSPGSTQSSMSHIPSSEQAVDEGMLVAIHVGCALNRINGQRALFMTSHTIDQSGVQVCAGKY